MHARTSNLIESDDVISSSTTERESTSVTSTASLCQIATDSSGEINTMVKKKHVLTSVDVVCIQDRDRANAEHVTRAQSVEIGTNRQQVNKAREGSFVAKDDATSASMTRTTVGAECVTGVPRIGIIRQQDAIDRTAKT